MIEELVKLQREYIEFLSKDISDNAGYLHAHGIITSQEKVEEGKTLRLKIKEVEDKIQKA